jgi:hypothetical protein
MILFGDAGVSSRRVDEVVEFCGLGRRESAAGTFETCLPILRMSVHRGRPEVAVIRSKRRE